MLVPIKAKYFVPWIAHGDYNLFYNPYPLEKYGLSSYIDKHGLNWHTLIDEI